MAADDEWESTRVKGMTHGQVCYLQIPALELAASAAFYEKVFGWKIERPYPSFEAPGLIGQWVTDRPPAPTGGLLAWINVEDIAEALESFAFERRRGRRAPLG